ncbi:hypothetical protein [uncultured Chitinophaga sp.]|uniref:hypothetical protein n=1 Tax=uncultured Chitinophaga sp. TaxID=339340 RepID=UPI0025E43D9E|nr:hypothetical protein [uncultured Chitinophaga sp.]
MKRFTLLLLMMLAGLGLNAQTIAPGKQTLGRMTSASPDAEAIAMYQSYPVDYMTGAPSIEIPLFEVPTRVGVLPFKLNYHVGSLKPGSATNVAGWGWSLTPNIGVTRAVKGGVDGPTSGFPANTQFGSTTPQYLVPASQNILDQQPDDFFYSLLSKSGRFIYDHSGNFVTLPYEAIKVSHPENNSFVITDDDGTIYKFGKYSTGSALTTEFSASSDVVLTGWRVSEIIPFDKSDTVRFFYGTPRVDQIPYYNIRWKITEYPEFVNPGLSETWPTHTVRSYYSNEINVGDEAMRPELVYSMLNNVPLEVDFTPPPIGQGADIASMTGQTVGTPAQNYAWSIFNYGSNAPNEDALSVNATDYRPLTLITFKGGEVRLTYSGTQLASVELSSRTGSTSQLTKHAVLYQHQLQHGPADQPLLQYNSYYFRHGLDSVKVNGLTYKMDYNAGSIGIYGGFNTDFWGFFNNRRQFTVPKMYYLVNNYSWNSALTDISGSPGVTGANYRSPMWLEIGGKQETANPYPVIPGIIKRLHYPTGGHAEFTFENNQYRASYSSEAVFGGGVRIKQIKYATGDGRDSLMKVYKYGWQEDGTGRTRYQNYDKNFMSQQLILTQRASETAEGGTIDFLTKVTTVNSKPHLDMSFSSGAGVIYQDVAEYAISMPDSVPLGKTVYNYVNSAKNEMWMYMTPLQTDHRTDWKEVSPSFVSQYRYKNGTFDLVNRTAFEYTDYYTDTVAAAQTFMRFVNANSSIDPLLNYQYYTTDPFAHLTYDIYAGVRKQTAIIDTVFNPDVPGEYIASRTNIAYEPTNYYKSQDSRLNSKNTLVKMQYYYPFQTSSLTNLPSGQLPILSSLRTANRINQPVEVRRYNQETVMETVQQQYTNFSGTRIYPSSIYTSTQNHSLEKTLEMGLYDNNGNILEQRRADDVMEVYLWGYNSRYPVAKVVGSSFAVVQGFISQSMLDNAQLYTDAQIRTELNKIRTGLAATKAQVLTYTYKPMIGATSETDANGVTRFYEYDSKGRLSLIKDHNGNILKMICYSYSGQPEDCGTGN